jgi:hypothetical protein
MDSSSILATLRVLKTKDSRLIVGPLLYLTEELTEENAFLILFFLTKYPNI